MLEVEELFPGEQMVTTVWVSADVIEALAKYRRHDRRQGDQLLERLRRYAAGGFSNFECPSCPIRSEWDGVFRIGHPSGLFRLIGFYEHDDRANFIVVDAFMKSGQKLSASERLKIDSAAAIRESGQWRRRGT